jgi:uncharacterized protein with GYD domain
LTTRHYDILTVSDVPDGIATAKVALSVGSAGKWADRDLARVHRGRVSTDRGASLLSG